ncbi:MAG: hypothetical protein ACLR7F_02385, partial [Waltera sp.]
RFWSADQKRFVYSLGLSEKTTYFIDLYSNFYIESVYFIKIETKYKNCAFLRKSVTCEKIITKNCSNNL